jgi:hypothetical protein
MNSSFHPLSDLFAQLGLDASEAGIEAFIAHHRLHDDAIALPDAPFWSAAQADFLREALAQDSDWAEAADQLNLRLR